MAEEAPPGELAAKESRQFGDWAMEGAGECEKEAGDEGGASIAVVWLLNPVVVWGWFDWAVATFPSGIREAAAAGTIRLSPFFEPKQDNALKHPTHRFFCETWAFNAIINY